MEIEAEAEGGDRETPAKTPAKPFVFRGGGSEILAERYKHEAKLCECCWKNPTHRVYRDDRTASGYTTACRHCEATIERRRGEEKRGMSRGKNVSPGT